MIMKEIYMLAGVGVGMIAGVMLYKHCSSAKKVVDNAEKTITKEAGKIKTDLKAEMKDMKKGVSKKEGN